MNPENGRPARGRAGARERIEFGGPGPSRKNEHLSALGRNRVRRYDWQAGSEGE